MRCLTCLALLFSPLAFAAEVTTGNVRAMDWDLLLKALGFVLAAITAIFQARGLRLTLRSSLKTDLEIIKLLDPADSSYQAVKSTVDRSIARIYGLKDHHPVDWDFRRIAITSGGLLGAVGFAYWTFDLARPTFSWWSLLTGYLALGAFGWFIMGASGRDSKRESKSAPPERIQPR